MLFNELDFFLNNFELIESSPVTALIDTNGIYLFYYNTLFKKKELVNPDSQLLCDHALDRYLIVLEDTITTAQNTLPIDACKNHVHLHYPWDKYLLLKAENKRFFRLEYDDFSIRVQFSKKKNTRLIKVIHEGKLITKYKFVGNKMMEKEVL